MNRSQRRIAKKVYAKNPNLRPPYYAIVGKEEGTPWAHGKLPMGKKDGYFDHNHEGAMIMFDCEGWTREEIILWSSRQGILLELDDDGALLLYTKVKRDAEAWEQSGHFCSDRSLAAVNKSRVLEGKTPIGVDDDMGLPPVRIICGEFNEVKLTAQLRGV